MEIRNEETQFPLFHIYFENRVIQNKNNVAIFSRHHNIKLTYHEVNEKANQLAHYLIELNIKNDSTEQDTTQLPPVIGILFEQHDPNWIIALLAILKAGLAFVLLDPFRLDAESKWGISFRLENCYSYDNNKSIILISNKEIYNKKFQTIEKNYHVIYLDEPNRYFKFNSHIENPNRKIEPDDLAYIAYTSGSTGEPKGIAINHKGLPFCFESAVADLGISENDHVYQGAGLTFDACIWDVMLSLSTGSTLCLHYPNIHGETQPIRMLGDDLEKYKITFTTLTPTQLNFLLTQLQKSYFNSLQTIVAAGEAPSKDVLTEWCKAGKKILNGYGPTECTIGVILYPYLGDNSDIALGNKPFKGTVIKLVDENNNFIETGCGEIWIEGHSLARGYIKNGTIDCAMTDEKFIIKEELRYYRTGDKASLENGLFYFKGRFDDELEINGERVNPYGAAHKVKEALMNLQISCSGVFVGETLIEQSGERNKKLTAYIISNDEKIDKLTSNSILESLKKIDRDRAPDIFYYVTPSSDITLEHYLKCNNNGKLSMSLCIKQIRDLYEKNKIQIKAIGYGNSSNDDESILSSKINEIWAKAIGIQHEIIFDKHKTFYELGGDSLNVTHFYSQFQSAFGVSDACHLLPPQLTIDSVTQVVEHYTVFKPIYQNIKTSLFIRIDKHTDTKPTVDTPLFCLCPVDGSGIDEYKALNEHLKNEKYISPLYALRPLLMNDEIGLNNEAVLLDTKFFRSGNMSLAYQAHAVILSMKAFQPKGPFRIAGWSYGGLLAYEVACQLQSQNEQIDYLGIFDSQAAGSLAKKDVYVLTEHILAIINRVINQLMSRSNIQVPQAYVLKMDDIKLNNNPVECIQLVFDYCREQIKKSISMEYEKFFKRLDVMQAHFTCIFFYAGHHSESIPNAFLYQAQNHKDYNECHVDNWKLYIKDIEKRHKLIEGTDHFNLCKSGNLSIAIKQDMPEFRVRRNWNIPRLIERYVDRKELYEEAIDILKIENIDSDERYILTLVGNSGSGKTTLANKIMCVLKNKYSFCAWFRADNITQLYHEYLTLSTAFNIPYIKKDIFDCIKQVKYWIENNESWLLVYDNAQNQIDLAEYLPHKGGSIIITSTNLNWQNKKIVVSDLNPKEADSLITLYLGTTPESPESHLLAKKLNYSARLITQACVYIKQSPMPIFKFLNLLEAAPKTMHYHLPADSNDRHLAIIINIILDALEYQSSTLILFINIIAYFNPNKIPLSLLLLLVPGAKKSDFLDDSLVRQSQLNALISLLGNYTLIEVISNGDFYSLREEIQIIIRSRHEREYAQTRLILAAYYLDNLYQEADYRGSFELMPHLETIYQHCHDLKLDYLKTATTGFKLSNLFIKILFDLANIHGCRRLNNLEKAQSYCDQAIFFASLLDNPRELLNSIDTSTRYYPKDLEGWKQRKIVQEFVLEQLISYYGEDDHDVAVVKTNLGQTFCFLGDINSATKMFESSITIKIKCFGEDKNLISPLFNLGSIYTSNNDFVNAKSKYKQVINLCNKYDKKEELYTTYLSLARVYYYNNKYQKALNMLEPKLYEIGQYFGDNDINLAKYYDILAICSAELGETDIEEKYSDRCFSIIRNCPEIEHVTIAENLIKYGTIYLKIGRIELAIKKFSEGLFLFEIHYKQPHPDTENARIQLGKAYRQFGDKKGDDLCILGKSNLLSIQTTHDRERAINLLYKHQLLDEDEQKKIPAIDSKISLHCSSIQKKASKEKTYISNRSTFFICAKTQYAQGILSFNSQKYDEAIHNLKIALEIYEKIYGRNNPIVSAIYYRVAFSYFKTKEYDQAIHFFEIVIHIDDVIPPYDKLDLAEHYYLLGLSYYKQNNGCNKDADIYFEKALGLYGSCEGDHEEIIKTILELCSKYPERSIKSEKSGRNYFTI